MKFPFYILLFLLAFQFDGKIFCVAIQSACASSKKRNKTPRQICYVDKSAT